MAKHAFDKFTNKEPKGAKKKELIKQEKRKVKKETRQAWAAKQELRKAKHGLRNENHTVGKALATATRHTGKVTSKQATKLNLANPAENTAKPHVVKRQINKAVNTPQGRQDEAAPATNGAENKRVVKRQLKKAGSGQPQYTQPQNPHEGKPFAKQPNRASNHTNPANKNPQQATDQMPLNKFIAHAGVCARREAADLVKQGKVTVNGSIVYEPGFKVTPADKVQVKGKQLFLQHNLVYILLNKPKDYLTTAKDPEGRKTVFDIIAGATEERVFAVGRLDRNTTGVLLLTNDGELAQKLTHPSYEIRKIYEVKLDKDVTKKDFEAILAGVTLEDGFVAADSLAYADAKDKSVIGIEIHSGRNRVVRRIFEHLGYNVKSLDRVMFANLTKKNVDRGKFRFLHEKEVRLLKYMNQSFLRKGAGE